MEIRWLQDFLSLAETGNFTEAAKTRHSSQPAFSRRVQALEAWLGVALIDRSSYPTTLTPAGEQFRGHAAELVRRIIDSRSELKGEPPGATGSITFAMTHGLATTRFPQWWRHWQAATGPVTTTVLATNLHDAVSALVDGRADLLICYHHAQLPLFLDAARYRRLPLGTDHMRPYAAGSGGRPAYLLPGTAQRPAPLLSYSPGAFLGRIVTLIMQSAPAPLHTETVFVSDLADALRGMAVAGHGIAWLPESTARAAVEAEQLMEAGDARWSLPMTLSAYYDRKHASAPVTRLVAGLLREVHAA